MQDHRTIIGTEQLARGARRHPARGDRKQDDTAGESSVSLLLNDGVGKMTLAAIHSVARAPAVVRLGDLNGDGALDIVTGRTYVEGATSSVSALITDP